MLFFVSIVFSLVDARRVFRDEHRQEYPNLDQFGTKSRTTVKSPTLNSGTNFLSNLMLGFDKKLVPELVSDF